MKKVLFLAAVALMSTVVACNKKNEPVDPLHVAVVTVDPSAATISRYSTVQLTALVMPVDATDKSVSWSMDNSTVASVK